MYLRLYQFMVLLIVYEVIIINFFLNSITTIIVESAVPLGHVVHHSVTVIEALV
jgi:hypothetical protein